ncbi:MAG: hypothetical protein IIB16_05685 [Chloroflexi bacterium]|nr:hypothetical protein [Chloroflexota bacterium]
MPESETNTRGRTKVRHQQEPAQHVSSPEQIAIESADGLETTLLTLEPGLGGAFSQATFERHAKLLGDPRMSQSMYTRQRTEIVRRIQRDYGNRYVQRLVDHIQQTKTRDIQAKLTVGPASDAYEREADQVARQVMGKISANSHESVQRADEEEDEALRKPLLQRQVDEEEEAIQAKPILQRQVGAEGGDAGSEVDSAITQARGHGKPLPDGVRGDMKTAFGALPAPSQTCSFRTAISAA